MRFGIVILAQFSIWIRTSRVEIAQANPAQPVGGSTGLHILNEELAFTVWIDGALGMVFGKEWLLRYAIGGARGRKITRRTRQRAWLAGARVPTTLLW